MPYRCFLGKCEEFAGNYLGMPCDIATEKFFQGREKLPQREKVTKKGKLHNRLILHGRG